MTKSTFTEVKENHMPTLEMYVPIVDKVHGAGHPEFHDVRKLFEKINEIMGKSGSEKPQLDEELALLRKVTDNYRIPDDVCESYEAVYNMLAEIDEAYRQDI